MIRNCLFFLFLLCVMPIVTVAGETGAKSEHSLIQLADSALSLVGMTHNDVRFDQDEMATWGGDRWRRRYFTMLHKNPFKLPKYGSLNLNSLSGKVTNLTALLSEAGKKIDHPIRRGLIGDQLAQYMDTGDSMPKPSFMRGKNALVDEQYKSLREGIDLVFAIADDEDHLFRRGLGEFNKDKFRERLWEYFAYDNAEYGPLVEEITESIDFDRLYAGAQDLTEAVKRLADSVEHYSFPSSKREIKSRLGLIVIGTTGADEYEYHEPPFLIIDGGGDDIYRFSGTNSDFPFSAIVDRAGNDSYESTDSTGPGIAGALLGLSILIDIEGDDTYFGKTLAQGAGLFGVGLLCDKSGDDLYFGENLVQGAGSFGIGIHADSSGHDSLYCIVQSQGYGYSRGCGIIVNYEGNDKYVAENDSLINASSQSGTDNSSLAQGCAFGNRADYLDGHSWAGGIGILCDRFGDDRYSAGLFAQGCAYWFAVGMLLDGDGHDVYDGIWYVQGSGAHFGVGLLDDFAGDDKYNPNTDPKNMAVGAGHDFTIGFLNERGGNDVYNVPNLSLGGGNANGIGIFVDHGGNDQYQTKQGTTLGRARGLDRGARAFLHTFGLFIDMSGTDSYTAPWATEKSVWRSPVTNEESPSSFEIGVGIDF